MSDEELRSLVEDLRDRVDELEAENEQLRDRIEEFEDRPSVEFRGDDPVMKNIWVGNHPLGMVAGENRDRLISVKNRVEDIERGEIDPGEVVAETGKGPDPEDLLPIHQIYNTVTSVEHHQHDVSARKELAGRVFPHFADYAFSNEGRLVLKSTKVKDILQREVATPELAKRLDVEDPNPNTVREVMKWMGQFGDDVLTFDTESGKQNQVVADREDWIEYTEDVMGRRQQPTTADQDAPVTNEVDEEFDQLTEADHAVATDGGGR